MIKKPRGYLLIIMVLFVLTGCWDTIEIEDRAFVTTLAIDKYFPDSGEKLSGGREPPKDVPRNRYIFTFSFPSADINNSESKDSNIIYTTVGSDLYTTSKILATRINLDIFLGHLDAIILGDAIVNDVHLFREILDVIEREPLIVRKVKLLATSGLAEEALKVEPSLMPITGKFVDTLFRNKGGSSRSGSGEIGKILIELHRSGDVSIPRIVPAKNDISVAGSAVIKNFQLVGWLGEKETRAIEIIKGMAKPDNFSIPYGIEDVKDKGAHKYNYHFAAVSAIFLPVKFYLVQEDPLKININVGIEGEIRQFYLDPHQSLLETKMINRIEDKFSTIVTEELEGTIKKLQKDFKVDLIGMDEYITKYHPKLWEKVKDDWGDVFPLVDISIDVTTNIQRIGMKK